MSGGNRMRRTLGIGMIALLIAGANAWAWPWKKSAAKPIPLEEIMRTPAVFQGRVVEFECRFAMRGNLFKYLNTRFNPGEHANFAVWPVDAKLWDSDERRNVLPTVYVNKDDSESLGTFNTLGRYEIVRVVGTVHSKYANLPWILVSSVKRVEDDKKKDEELCDDNEYTEVGIRHVQNGLKLLDENKPRMAARHLSMALEAGIPTKHHGYLQLKCGEAYFAYGAYAEAIESYQQAVGSEGEMENAELYLMLAEAQLRQGEAEAAKSSCEDALQLSADYPLVHAFLGEAEAKLGSIDLALEQCDLALTTPGITASDKAKAEVSKARVLAMASQYADAVRAYARAIGEGSPLAADATLRKEIGALYEGRFDENGRIEFLDEAIREYGNAVVLAENKDPESLFLSARAQFKKIKAQNGTDFAPVLELLNQALNLDPKYTPAIGLKAKILLEQGKVSDASRLLETAAADPAADTGTLMTLADLYQGQGRGADAMGLYQRVLTLDPVHRMALERRASLAESLGLLDDARQSYELLVTLHPQEMAYRLQLGHVLARVDDVMGAESQWKSVMISEDILGTEAGVQLMRLYARQQRFGAMEDVSRTVLERKAEHVEAQWSLARALAEQEKSLEEAEGWARKALIMEPKNLKAQEALAVVLIKQGRSEEAAEVLEKTPLADRTRSMWFQLALARGEGNMPAGSQDALMQAAQAPRPQEDPMEAARLIEQARALIKAETENADTSAMAPDASGQTRRSGFFSRLNRRNKPVEKVEETAAPVEEVTVSEETDIDTILRETEQEVSEMRNIAESIPVDGALNDASTQPAVNEAPAVNDPAAVSANEFSWSADEESIDETSVEATPVVAEEIKTETPVTEVVEEDEDADVVSIPGMVEPQTTKELKADDYSTMQGPEVQYRNEVMSVPLAKVLHENETIVTIGAKADAKARAALEASNIEVEMPETPELEDVSANLPAWAQ